MCYSFVNTFPYTKSLLRVTSGISQKLSMPHKMGEARQYRGKHALQEHVFSPDSGIFLCILNGRCWFIIIFPLYNSCYLSNLTEIFVTGLDSTYFVWPCNYWKYRCYLWLRQISCNAHVPGCLVICAPEPSHNAMIISLYKNNFTNTHSPSSWLSQFLPERSQGW